MNKLCIALIPVLVGCVDLSKKAENELGPGVTCWMTSAPGVANCLGKSGHFVCFVSAHHGAACLRTYDDLERR